MQQCKLNDLVEIQIKKIGEPIKYDAGEIGTPSLYNEVWIISSCNQTNLIKVFDINNTLKVSPSTPFYFKQ